MDIDSEFLIRGLLIACALLAGRLATPLGVSCVAAYLLVDICFSSVRTVNKGEP